MRDINVGVSTIAEVESKIREAAALFETGIAPKAESALRAYEHLQTYRPRYRWKNRMSDEDEGFEHFTSNEVWVERWFEDKLDGPFNKGCACLYTVPRELWAMSEEMRKSLEHVRPAVTALDDFLPHVISRLRHISEQPPGLQVLQSPQEMASALMAAAKRVYERAAACYYEVEDPPPVPELWCPKIDAGESYLGRETKKRGFVGWFRDIFSIP